MSERIASFPTLSHLSHLATNCFAGGNVAHGRYRGIASTKYVSRVLKTQCGRVYLCHADSECSVDKVDKGTFFLPSQRITRIII